MQSFALLRAQMSRAVRAAVSAVLGAVREPLLALALLAQVLVAVRAVHGEVHLVVPSQAVHAFVPRAVRSRSVQSAVLAKAQVRPQVCGLLWRAVSAFMPRVQFLCSN